MLVADCYNSSRLTMAANGPTETMTAVPLLTRNTAGQAHMLSRSPGWTEQPYQYEPSLAPMGCPFGLAGNLVD